MLSSVIKNGVFILISMSFCVYADQLCTLSDACNIICTGTTQSKNCRELCGLCETETDSTFIRTGVCDFEGHNPKCHGNPFCRNQCEDTEDSTYPESSSQDVGSGQGETEEVGENMTTTQNMEEGKGDSTIIKAIIGSVTSVIIVIGLVIIIWYFMKKKSRKRTTPQSVSYNVENISYGTTDEIHSKEISENNRVHIEVQDDSENNTLYDTITETKDYTYASYPGDSGHQSKPTVYAEVSNDSPEYYALQKERESDVTELTSDVKAKPTDMVTLKQDGSQSEYMCLQLDASITTNTPPPLLTQKEEDAEYTFASYPDDYRDGSEPTGCAKVSNGLPEYYAPKNNDVTRLNITSLQNDDAYDELKLDGNESNENSYNTLNHSARINLPDDITNDYNKLMPTPAFDEESEEYSHLNRTLKTDESVTDQGYGKLELPTEPASGSIKPTKGN